MCCVKDKICVTSYTGYVLRQNRDVFGHIQGMYFKYRSCVVQTKNISYAKYRLCDSVECKVLLRLIDGVCSVKYRAYVVSYTGFVLCQRHCQIAKHFGVCQAQDVCCVKYWVSLLANTVCSVKHRLRVVSNTGFVFGKHCVVSQGQDVCCVKYGVVSWQTLCVLSNRGFVMSQIQDLSFGKHCVVVQAQGACCVKYRVCNVTNTGFVFWQTPCVLSSK